MPATTVLPPLTVILADRDVDALDAHDLRRLTDAASDGHVVLVAPAGPVEGERWIVDLTARRAHAQGRLEAWSAVLAPYARSIATETGDACPRRALANACDEHRPAAALALAPQATVAGTRAALLDQLMAHAQQLASMARGQLRPGPAIATDHWRLLTRADVDRPR